MTTEQKIENLISQMTIKEKVAMCRANSKFYSNGVERLGIDELALSDGPHGVREEYERHRWVPLGRKEDECTYLPTGSSIAATWNRDLFYSFGDCLGGEARARGKDIILGPGINVVRNPLCGRNFEYFSEDSFLISEIAAAMIKGIQKNDVASCVKHYAVNNQELSRSRVNVRVSKRALYETYLSGFEAAVKEGKVYAVMGAYNKFEGEHCCHNKYLVKDVLKGEWEFGGVYITDWGGCHDLEQAVFNGLDLEMGTSEDYSKFYFTDKFEEMAENDINVSAELDEKVRRILRLMFRVKKFDKDRSKGEFNSKRHQQIAYDIAAESMVLLKNDDNILPIRKNIKEILVIGENANAKHALGGNSSYVRALYEVSLLEGLKNRCPEGANITYIPNALSNEKPISPELTDIVDTETGCRGFVRKAYDNLYCSGEVCETKFFNSPVLTGEPRTEFTYRYSATINIPEDDEYKFVVSGRRGVRVFINKKKVICFDADETMKKVYSSAYKKGEKVDILIEVQPQTPNPVLELGWIRKSEETDTGLEEIINLAKNADSVIYCGGLNHDYDTEGQDRTDMRLPDEQNEIIEKLLDARRDTIIVMTSGSPIEMPWIEQAKTVLLTGYAGMEGGNAFADIIFGNISPCGHLPVTMPYKYEDSPVARYGEYNEVDEYYYDDIYVGYKGYEKDNIKPMFCFGHGLTYSEFEYSDFCCNDNKLTFNVKNTGSYRAKTVLQMYIGKFKKGVDFPVKELKDFKKIELMPNECKQIEFSVGFDELKYYDEELSRFTDEIEGYSIYIGESAEKIVYSNKLCIE